MGFGKRGFVLRQRAIHLVGRDMQKAKACFLSRRQCRPVTAHRFEQTEGADDIGFNELARSVNGTVDMTLSGKVDHRTGLVGLQQLRDQIGIANVALHKDVVRVALQAGQGFQIARVGQLVQIDHSFRGLSQPIQNKIGANEAGTAGDKKSHKALRWVCRRPR